MNINSAYDCLAPHFFYLRFSGFFPIDSSLPKSYKYLHVLFMRVTLVVMILYMLQQSLKIIEEKDDVDKVMGTLFLFLTHTDSIYKQGVIYFNAQKIQELLEIMKGSLFNQGEADHKKYLQEAAYYGKLFLRGNNIMALSTCFLWVVYPVILHIQGKEAEFAIWLPYDVNINHTTFYSTALYVWIVTSWYAFTNISIDITVAFFLAQCQAQLSILSNNLIYLVERSKAESLAIKECLGNIIERRFTIIVQHHIQILYFSRKVQDIFGCAVAYQFLISAWIICLSVHRLVDTDPTTVQFWSMVLYILCMVVQVFVYCYYGNEVTHESRKLIQSAYYMNWLEIPLKHQKYLIFFMERIKVPILPLAGYIIPLSNNTLVSILKSSYSFYALLKNTGNKT